VFADKLNHASLIDAMQLAKANGADVQRYPHNDMAALKKMLAASTATNKLIVSDAVFSMDGDLAPLPLLFALAERYDAWLVIDDAHGFGVLGPHGRGSLAHFNLPASPRILLMGTLGKAAGVGGAFVAGSATAIEYLLQKGRSYIFTTAAPPAMACALSKSLEIIRHGDALRTSLFARIAQLRDGLAGLPWPLLPSLSAIQPLIVGDNEAAVALSGALWERGLWVPAIRPPTVPKGTARLRISVSAAHTEADIAGLIGALKELA
jgi:8-amino-7-oxononanoate synthase